MSKAKDDFIARTPKSGIRARRCNGSDGIDLVIDKREGYFLYDMDGAG